MEFFVFSFSLSPNSLWIPFFRYVRNRIVSRVLLFGTNVSKSSVRRENPTVPLHHTTLHCIMHEVWYIYIYTNVWYLPEDRKNRIERYSLARTLRPKGRKRPVCNKGRKNVLIIETENRLQRYTDIIYIYRDDALYKGTIMIKTAGAAGAVIM